MPGSWPGQRGASAGPETAEHWGPSQLLGVGGAVPQLQAPSRSVFVGPSSVVRRWQQPRGAAHTSRGSVGGRCRARGEGHPVSRLLEPWPPAQASLVPRLLQRWTVSPPGTPETQLREQFPSHPIGTPSLVGVGSLITIKQRNSVQGKGALGPDKLYVFNVNPAEQQMAETS